MEENQTFIRPNYKKDAIVNTVANILYLFVLWLMTFLTPILGNFNDAGVFTLALSVSNICTAFSTYNISVFQSSDIKKKYSNTHYLYFGFTTTLISFAIAVILCLSFGYLNSENGVMIFFAIILYYVFKSAENVSNILYISMQKQGKMYLSGYSLIVKAVLMLGIFCLVYFLSKSFVLTMGVLAASSYLYLAFVDLRLTKKYCGNVLKITKDEYKHALKLFVAAFAVCVYGICFAMIPSLPRMIYERLYDTVEVGYFGTMAAITVLIQAAVNALLTPFIPKITDSFMNHKKKEFYQTTLGFVALIAGLTLVAFIMVYFLGDWALKLFYGSEILAYSDVFKWIVLATGLQTLVILLATIVIAMRKKLAVLIVSLLGLAVMGSISYLFVHQSGMMGIVYIYYISYGVMAIGLLGVIVYVLLKRRHENKEVTNA